MQPLGLTGKQLDLYHARLFASHDFDVDVDILNLNESHRGRLTGEFIDGQINLQQGGFVARTATFSLHDPDHTLHLDAESPFDGAVFFDRMVRVRHTVNVPTVGRVTAVPFVGPITKITREGSVLTVECSDKAVLASEGRRPMTRRKGHNAVDAIRDFMAATGEQRFRFTVPDRLAKKRLDKDYSVGWTRSPWAVCQQIARGILGLQLLYSADGALLLRPKPSRHVITYSTGNKHAGVTSGIKVEYDASKVRNIVRVTGAIPPKKNSDKKAKSFTEGAIAPRKHPMSPWKLGRNGAERYLPKIIEDKGIHTHADAKDRAERELDALLPIQVTASWDAVPFFHLDNGDVVVLKTPDGSFRSPFESGSIPLGLGGDMSFGAVRRVSRPRRTGRRAK